MVLNENLQKLKGFLKRLEKIQKQAPKKKLQAKPLKDEIEKEIAFINWMIGASKGYRSVSGCF
ncbi:MAG: hypothetical protein AAB410_01890 [Patescibacteria group bacterium]